MVLFLKEVSPGLGYIFFFSFLLGRVYKYREYVCICMCRYVLVCVLFISAQESIKTLE